MSPKNGRGGKSSAHAQPAQATRHRTPGSGPATRRSAPGAAGAAGASGGTSQTNVQTMINRLNQNTTRSSSPAKRLRERSASRSSSGREDEPAIAPDTLSREFMHDELNKLASLVTAKIDRSTETLRAELQQIKQRLYDLENHVEAQGETIERLRDQVSERDQRIQEMEGIIAEMEREKNMPYLVFDGSGVPPPPAESPWMEDVAETTVTLLHKYMPDTEVSTRDIAHSYRISKGKKIVCKFARIGRGSVRDAVYEKRATLGKDQNAQPRERSDQLFVNEMLSQGTHTAFMQLRAAKKNGQIHSVHTRYTVKYLFG